MEHVVERAVQVIRERYAEPLSLDDIARSVMVSKFHLLRLFTRITGVTPGRFLSAVRLAEAKRLLTVSELNVADVSSQVGYSSTGSFTRRFTESVGIPPTQYRKLSREGREPVAPVEVSGPSDDMRCRLRGVVRSTATPLSSIYVGAFDSPILQGQPASWTTVERPGPFTLTGVPCGTRFLHAAVQAVQENPLEELGVVLLTATLGPVHIDPFATFEVELVLRPRDWSRPPILFALPGFDMTAAEAA
ncbi:helix-turn-helix domain-containing protein [Streptomyces sp. NPDC053367]|uniref:helix-turn-helix domain-containing protein n=1 Tax=Streptomyces sp. NPDC053367 TaxID=3365700 RepID=UPI0037D1EC02